MTGNKGHKICLDIKIESFTKNRVGVVTVTKLTEVRIFRHFLFATYYFRSFQRQSNTQRQYMTSQTIVTDNNAEKPTPILILTHGAERFKCSNAVREVVPKIINHNTNPNPPNITGSGGIISERFSYDFVN